MNDCALQEGKTRDQFITSCVRACMLHCKAFHAGLKESDSSITWRERERQREVDLERKMNECAINSNFFFLRRRNEALGKLERGLILLLQPFFHPFFLSVCNTATPSISCSLLASFSLLSLCLFCRLI